MTAGMTGAAKPETRGLYLAECRVFYGRARGVAAEGFRVKSARMRREAVDAVRVSCDDRVKREHGSHGFSCRRVRGMNIFTDSVKGEM